MTMMDPREYDGNAPPNTVAAAMQEPVVVITPVYRSITHSEPIQEALANDVRVVSLVKHTPEQLVTCVLYADYEAMRPYCEEMAAKLADAEQAHRTSPVGTDATFDLRGRSGNAPTRIADSTGDFTAAVNIEANVEPIKGETEGG